MKTCLKIFREIARALDRGDAARLEELRGEAERRCGREELLDRMAEYVVPRLVPYFADQALALYRRLRALGHPQPLMTALHDAWGHLGVFAPHCRSAEAAALAALRRLRERGWKCARWPLVAPLLEALRAGCGGMPDSVAEELGEAEYAAAESWLRDGAARVECNGEAAYVVAAWALREISVQENGEE